MPWCCGRAFEGALRNAVVVAAAVGLPSCFVFEVCACGHDAVGHSRLSMRSRFAHAIRVVVGLSGVTRGLCKLFSCSRVFEIVV